MSGTGPIHANKDELSRALGWSKPTLDAFLKDHPDAPVVTRGSNGVEWQFDVETFMGFVHDVREAEEEKLKARRAELDRWALPLGVENEGAGKATDIVAMLRANKLAKEAGLLVPVSEMRQKALPVMTKISRFLDGLPGQIGRRFHLPDAVVRAIEKMIADQREQLVAEIRALFADAPTDDVLRDGTHH